MSLEADLAVLLGPLAGSRAYPDVTPDDPTYPLIVYQFVGGRAGWYLEKKMPSHLHARVQVWTWSTRRLEASNLARAVEKKICESTLIAEPLGAFVSTHVAEGNLYGTRQDYGIWYPNP